MEAWVVWLVIAGLLGAIELTTLTLIVGSAAFAAVGAGVVDLAGGPLWLQLVTFSVVLLLSLLVVRPVARRHTAQGPHVPTNVDALVGQPAVVLERVDRDGGQVKLAGEVWTARSADPDRVIETGARVRVAAIYGATALVTEADS